MSWPFRDWQRIAVQQFHMSPSDFWALPLAEWLALITPRNAPMGPTRLTQLMKDYPDD